MLWPELGEGCASGAAASGPLRPTPIGRRSDNGASGRTPRGSSPKPLWAGLPVGSGLQGSRHVPRPTPRKTALWVQLWRATIDVWAGRSKLSTTGPASHPETRLRSPARGPEETWTAVSIGGWRHRAKDGATGLGPRVEYGVRLVFTTLFEQSLFGPIAGSDCREATGGFRVPFGRPLNEGNP